MKKHFRSIFQRSIKPAMQTPEREKPLMRALEPRVLLDAAAVETAIDIAGQAAHQQFADDYMANSRPANELAPENLQEDLSSAGAEDDVDDEAGFDGVSARRTDREIVFIDAGVENRETLIASLEPDARIVIIEAGQNGLDQIAGALAGDRDYDAIHIFSHGTVGQLQLGDSLLNVSTMTGIHSQALTDIGSKLSEDADILIYGCDFGQGAEGERAARVLASVTGSDIAASNDLTGSESLAGDWDLEVSVGEVTSQSYTLPDWKGILPGYELHATSDPTVAHSNGGVNGTVGTQATWADAVSIDVGGGVLEYYDLRATIIGSSGEATATFETVSTTDPTLDDFRVVVTNLGEVEATVGGQDVLEEGGVTVLWEIFDAGTTDRADLQELNITLSDIDGLAGQPDTRDSIEIGLANLTSYTVENNSFLQVSNDKFSVEVEGTQDGVDDPRSQIAAYWAQTNQFLIIYGTRTQTTSFTMDGDNDVTFTTPIEQVTQSIDLDANDSAGTGNDFAVTYLDGLPAGPVADSPVILADVDLSLFDINNNTLQSVTVTLTNAHPGDDLGFDAAVLNDLGISGSVDYSVSGEITLTLSNSALLSNYETALKTVSYQNTNASFNDTENRIVTFSISDGIISTSGAQTVISFDTVSARPVAVPNVYVQDEDTTISASTATGLLANDTDAQGNTLTIVSARDSSGAVIVPLGAPHTTPQGAVITLNTDGSFTYIPDAHYSGSEFIEYTISDGTFLSTSWATFDIQPVVDDVDLQLNLADPTSNEDAPSNPLDITVTSPDSSETQTVMAEGIPEDVSITDGTNVFTSTLGNNSVNVTDWDRSQIRVLPSQGSDADITITIVAKTVEIDGSTNFAGQSVTFEVDAVADPVNLIAPEAIGPIDADMNIGEALEISLVDDDGSETITNIRFANIPAGAQIFVGGVERTIVGGAVNVTFAELDDVVMHPPQTGNDALYTINVTVTSAETNPENGVALATTTKGPVGLLVNLNDDDDPVTAVDDITTAASGVTVTIDVLDNDSIPDGGGEVVLVDGQTITTSMPVTLSNGQGVVVLNFTGELEFTPSVGFSGLAMFDYTAQDIDGSTSTAEVRVLVVPVWNITGENNVLEGTDAEYQITLSGVIRQGETFSAELSLQDVDTNISDYEDFVTAVQASIAANADQGFSFDGTTLSYTAPATGYTSVYEASGSTFATYDIAATGTALNLGDDGIASQALGFDFNFDGSSFDTVFVSANGYVTFGSPVDLPSNATLDGNAFGGRPAIAAYWDDLMQGAGNVFVETRIEPDGTSILIIQWQDVEHQNGGTQPATFQLILKESDGSICINYDDVILGGGLNNGASATVGIEGQGGMNTEYQMNGSAPLVSGSRVVFNQPTAASPTLNLDVAILSDGLFELDENFRLDITAPTNSLIGTDQVITTIGTSDNSDPVAVDDTVDVGETVQQTFNVITDVPGADSDPNAQLLTLTEINGSAIASGSFVDFVSGSRVRVFSDGRIIFQQRGAYDSLLVGQTATETFTYTVSDGFGGSDTATVVVTIHGENLAPVVDLEDDGTSPTRDSHTAFLPLDPAVQITANNAAIIDGDDTSFASLTLTLGDFLQAGQEIVTIFGEAITFGTAQTTTLLVNGTNHDLSYDGGVQIVIDLPGGAEMSAANVEDIIQGATYQNVSGIDLTGTRTVTFTINDGDDSGSAVAAIDVVGVNAAPVARHDGNVTPYSLVEDNSITILASTLLANDTDDDGDPLHISSVQNALNGTVVLNGAGDVVFTPDADFNGNASFQYTANDGNFGTDNATVFLVVTPADDAPRVDLNGAGAGENYTFTYAENDTPVSIATLDSAVMEIDGDNVDSANITILGALADDVFNVGILPGGIVGNVVPADASTGLSADGTVTITLSNAASAADYSAAIRAITFSSLSENPTETDRVVRVTATAGSLTSDVSVTRIHVSGVNDDPVAGNDGVFTADEGRIIRLNGSTLLVNDNDPDGDSLSLDAVYNPINGTVTIDGAGRAVFVPTPGYFGTASFSYVVTDGNGGMATGSVDLFFNEVNDLPVIDLNGGAGGQNFATTYTENDPAISIVHPTVTLSDLDDTHLEGATVLLTNGAIGDRLNAQGLPAGITVTVNPTGNLVVDGPVTLIFSGHATLADYEAALRAVRYESFSEAPSSIDRLIRISVNDGSDESALATARVQVIPVNDVPVANADGSFDVNEDENIVLNPASLLGNDSDLDGDTLTITGVSAPVNGTVNITAAGNVRFIPDAEYSGPASFEYTISDGNGGTDTATVTLNVVAVNDAPTINLDTGSPGRDYVTSYTENGVGIALADASIIVHDVDDAALEGASIVLNNGQVGDILEAPASVGPVSITISPAGALTGTGSITVTLSGSATVNEYEAALRAVTYRSTSEAPATVDRDISIHVNDGDDDSMVVTTTVQVIPVNDVPVANADGSFDVNEDENIVLNAASLLGNDSDLDGDTLTITGVSAPVNGTVNITAAGDVRFIPDAEYSGPASFEYTISDGNGGTDTATVTLNVVAVNDAPTINLDTGSPGRDYVTSYTENGVGIALADASIIVHDVDDAALEGASIVLNNGQVGDILEAPASVGPVSITISPAGALTGTGSITVTLSGSATVNEYEAALRAVTYRSTSEAPATVDRDISIHVNDGDDDSMVVTTTVQVIPVNDVPVANADGSFDVNEDENIVLNAASLLGNDSDLDGDTLTITGVSAPVNGTVNITAAGDVRFIPDAEYSGPASFEYTISDGNGGTDTATVTLNVVAVNDAPTINLDTGSPGRDYVTSYTENGVGIALADASIIVHDVDDAALEGASIVLNNGQVGDILEAPASVGPVSITISPAGALTGTGSITVTLSGSATVNEYEAALRAVTYRSTSEAPATVDRDISIHVNDGDDDSMVVTTTVQVIPVNDVPVANADGSFDVNEDENIVLNAASLLGNDSDLDGDTLTITGVSAPVNGTVNITAAGDVRFIPDAEYSGPASFEYTISDGNGGTDTATVTLNVVAVNDAPTINLDTGSPGRDYVTSYTENGVGIALADASIIVHDVDDAALEGASIVLNNGQVGDILEAPASVGPVSITISPAGALTGTGSITVTLSGSATVNEYEAALRAVTYRSTSEAPATVDRDISIHVNDGDDDSMVVTTTVQVIPVNDVPVANADGSFDVNEDENIVLNAASLLGNDSDLDGDTLTITGVSAPVNGTVNITAAGNVRFIPDAEYSGPASFEYTISDGNGGTDTATVTLNVVAVNDAPTINLDTGSPGRDYVTSYTENGVGIALADASIIVHDVDDAALEGASIVLNNGQVGDILEAPASVGPVSITISPAGALTGTGSITVTLSGSATVNEYEAALRAVTYRSTSEAPSTEDRNVSIVVNDGDDDSALAPTIISVSSINDAPVAADDLGFTMAEDGLLTFQPLANDADVDGDPLTITSVDGQLITPGGSVTIAEGQVDLSADGLDITFTPRPNLSGNVSFSYTISDGSLTDTATVSIDIIGVNDAPDAVDDGPVILVEDGSVSFDPVSANDSDLEGDALNIVAIDGVTLAAGATVPVTDGTIQLDADGRTLIFTPNPDFNGQTTITYRLSDGTDTDDATITFDVTPVNDAPVNVSNPIDRVFDDGEPTNFPIAQHFLDADGDALTYIATGLPAGLAIDAVTGTISGVVDSSASQTSPYTIVVQATDGTGPAASVSFVIDVNNPAPTGSADTNIVLQEGDSFSQNMSTLFNDPDGDALTYSATGLPAWASINAGNGRIVGTVPTDAELSGPVFIIVRADDGQGGVATTNVSFDPRNVAPVAISPARDIFALEETQINFNVAAHFVDGGSDTDSLTVGVSGLPDGLIFDPATGMISGSLAQGTSSPTPYAVTLTAVDTQGGTVTDTFLIRIGDFSVDPDPIDPFEDIDEVEATSEEERSEDAFGGLESILEDVDGLSGTSVLNGNSAILLDALSDIDPLHNTSLSGGASGAPINVTQGLAESTGWLSVSGYTGSDDWFVDGAEDKGSLIDENDEGEILTVGNLLKQIALEISRKGEGLFIEVLSTLPDVPSLKIASTKVSMPGGEELPDWMKLLREGYISANPPKGLVYFDLEVTTTLEDGRILTKLMRVDVIDTTVVGTNGGLSGSIANNVTDGSPDNRPVVPVFGPPKP